MLSNRISTAPPRQLSRKGRRKLPSGLYMSAKVAFLWTLLYYLGKQCGTRKVCLISLPLCPVRTVWAILDKPGEPWARNYYENKPEKVGSVWHKIVQIVEGGKSVFGVLQSLWNFAAQLPSHLPISKRCVYLNTQFHGFENLRDLDVCFTSHIQWPMHYDDVIMSSMAYQIISLTLVYSNSGSD